MHTKKRSIIALNWIAVASNHNIAIIKQLFKCLVYVIYWILNEHLLHINSHTLTLACTLECKTINKFFNCIAWLHFSHSVTFRAHLLCSAFYQFYTFLYAHWHRSTWAKSSVQFFSFLSDLVFFVLLFIYLSHFFVNKLIFL